VISWLAKWASDENNNLMPKLNQLGKEFVKLLADNDEMEVKRIEVLRQYNNIDVVLVINNGEYVICVEDKVDCGIHSNQLYKYKEKVKNQAKITIDSEEYELNEVVFCYLKTGDQNTFLSALAHGYNTINRGNLLELLEKYSDEIENDIFKNYYNYLKKLNEEKETSWYSLYKELTKELTLTFPEEELQSAIELWELRADNLKDSKQLKKKDAEIKTKYLKNNIDSAKLKKLAEDYMFINSHFTYVPNQSGGFSAFHWGNYNKEKLDTYLQIGDYKYKGEEKYRLMLRVGSLEGKDKSEKKEIRNSLYNQFTEKYPEHYVKPTRFSVGNSMAFAVLKDYQDIDFEEIHKNKEKTDKLVNALKRTLNHLDELGE